LSFIFQDPTLLDHMNAGLAAIESNAPSQGESE